MAAPAKKISDIEEPAHLKGLRQLVRLELEPVIERLDGLEQKVDGLVEGVDSLRGAVQAIKKLLEGKS